MRKSERLEHLQEVLYQCPGEQISDLGEAIASYAEDLKEPINIEDLRKRLRSWSASAYAIEPLVEVLHEIGDDVQDAKGHRGREYVEGLRPSPFRRDIETRYVQSIAERLRGARAEDNKTVAAHCVYLLQNYEEHGCTPLIRELAQSELRNDEAAYGETPSEGVKTRSKMRPARPTH